MTKRVDTRTAMHLVPTVNSTSRLLAPGGSLTAVYGYVNSLPDAAGVNGTGQVPGKPDVWNMLSKRCLTPVCIPMLMLAVAAVMVK